MTIPGKFQRTRTHPYGMIKGIVFAALDTNPRTTAEIIERIGGRLDDKTVKRNLSGMVTLGVILNVGSRRHALYRLP